tara:strand:+ start:1743 stop:2300 length:558 start_codon:yes stop_codon:yes gene_type:complete
MPMKKTRIKGKDYVMVDERIRVFWEKYPHGRITTERIDSIDSISGYYCFKATAWPDPDDMPEWYATGHADEYRDDKKSMVNISNACENGETSAVGRALGMLGILVEGSVASAEEVKNAIDKQSSANKADSESVLELESFLTKDITDPERKYIEGLLSNSKIPADQVTSIVKQMNERLKTREPKGA